MLRLENIRKTFDSTLAVDGLSLEIEKGEVFGLLGPTARARRRPSTCRSACLRPIRAP
jgi:ABC-2 type transport system ATP-binding protein